LTQGSTTVWQLLKTCKKLLLDIFQNGLLFGYSHLGFSLRKLFWQAAQDKGTNTLKAATVANDFEFIVVITS